MISKDKMSVQLKPQRSSFASYFKRDWQLYLLIALPLAWLLIFAYGPMYGIQIAFKDYRAVDGIFGSEWVGFEHFINFVTSYNFGKLMGNTIIISLYGLIAGFPMPIILALSLNCCLQTRLRKTVQFVIYMPHFISTVVMVGIILQFLSPTVGMINNFIKLFGGEAYDFMGDPDLFRHIYVWTGIWQSAGYGTIIYLAALAGIDPGLHEAAIVDGANRFKRILHVDLPGILPTTIILLIMNTGQILNVGFEKIYLMQNSLNLSVSEVISTFVYKIGLQSAAADFSYSTAIGLFRSAINIILIVTVNKVSKVVSENSLW